MKIYKNLLITIIDCGVHELFVPLIMDRECPLSRNECGIITFDEMRYIYDAEVSSQFYKYIFGHRLAEFRVITIRDLIRDIMRITSINKIATGTSNVIVLIKTSSRSYIYKGHRIYTKYNLEPQFLSYLTRVGFNGVPNIYAIIKYRDTNVGIFEEYIESIGDGGYPFWKSLLNYLKNMKSHDYEIPCLKVAVRIAKFHESMSLCNEGWCRTELISRNDISTWKSRLNSMYNYIKKFINEISPSSKYEVHKVLKEIEVYIEEASKEFSMFLDRVKMRIHQDLHLGQMLYTKQGEFLIVDFEGEPMRSEKDRLLKEPAIHDIATIIRGLNYLTIFGIARIENIEPSEVCIRILNNTSKIHKRALEWLGNVQRLLMKHYVRNSLKFSIQVHGVSGSEFTSWVWKAVRLWLIEKALYEMLYELQYRPGLVLVPLIGLMTDLKNIENK